LKKTHPWRSRERAVPRWHGVLQCCFPLKVEVRVSQEGFPEEATGRQEQEPCGKEAAGSEGGGPVRMEQGPGAVRGPRGSG
jgi:hypothetical protein